MLLLMTVEPGFGGQPSWTTCCRRCAAPESSSPRSGGEVWLQVDGGVSDDTIEQCAEAGADTFVAGSAVYGAEDAAEACRRLRSVATRAATAAG